MSIQRFPFIGEVEARTIEPGAVVEIDRGGHITPLAGDTLRARRVTVVVAGQAGVMLPADLAPAVNPARIVVGADAAGAKLAAALVPYLRGAGKSAVPVSGDDPDRGPVAVASAVAKIVARREADAGIVIAARAITAAIVATKIRGVRACTCVSMTAARESREQAGTNVLVLPASLTATEAIEIAKTWLSTGTTESGLLAIREIREALET